MPTQDRTSSENRLELLLFRLNGQQLFAINVLKIKEIISCPALTHLPDSNPTVRGVAELRGHTIPVIDLAMAIGRPALNLDAGADQELKIIIAEFNRSTQGFLISGVERIIVRDWTEVLPPPKGVTGGYITGVIKNNDVLVQIIDVERVIGEIIGVDLTASAEVQSNDALRDYMQGRTLLIVDDSSIARTQTSRTLDQLELPYITARDGREALALIHEMTEDCADPLSKLPMVISDIEMPEMDGYHLTEAIKQDPKLKDLYVLLHTSLDGQVNAEAAARVGADNVLTKFVPDALLNAVLDGLNQQMDHQ